jgi:anti-sigma B factor antagonist
LLLEENRKTKDTGPEHIIGRFVFIQCSAKEHRMHVTIDSSSNVTVIHIVGDFLSDTDQATFRHRIRGLVEKGARLFLVDLGDVNYMNSCGLGSLVCAFTTAKKAGGDVQFARAGSHVKDLLATTRLDKVFTVHPSMDEALAQLTSTKQTVAVEGKIS